VLGVAQEAKLSKPNGEPGASLSSKRILGNETGNLVTTLATIYYLNSIVWPQSKMLTKKKNQETIRHRLVGWKMTFPKNYFS